MQAIVLRMWFVLIALGILLLVVAPLSFVVQRVMIEVQERVNRTPLETSIDRTRDVALPYTVDEVPVAPSSNARTTIASGLRHTCVVTSASSVLCWGDNAAGQLGVGITGAVSPVRFTTSPVAGLTDVLSVAVGALHSCALRQGQGDVWCWGDNQFRQLGARQNGPQSAQTIPTQVISLPESTQIAAGEHHTCVRTIANEIWCWGDNQFAQIGATPSTNGRAPTQILGLPTDIVSLQAGANHTCVSTAQRAVWCWGDNASQQIDDSGDVLVVNPRQVFVEQASIQLGAANNSTCVVAQDFALSCRGANQYRARLSADAQLLSSALGQFCTVMADYEMTCWSDTVPATTQVVLGATMVSSGEGYVCVLLRAGLVQCRGDNKFGQIGQSPETSAVDEFVFVSLGASRQLMSAGYAHLCTIWQLGNVICWGRNLEGQLGLAVQDDVPFLVAPHEVPLNGVIDVVVSGNHSCVIRYDHRVSCWGQNSFGQLGSGDTISRSEPTTISSLTDVKQLALGMNHTCALLRDGRVACWGDNRFGQTAFAQSQHANPATVEQLRGVVKIAAGGNTTCALQNDGIVVCWGAEIGGQASFASITAIKDVVSMAVGFAHACAVQITGSVMCWGDYRPGATLATTPEQVMTLPAIRVVAVGGQHTCALDTQQNVWCWGDNRQGQVNGVPSDPLLQPELQARGVANVVTGHDFTCVRQQIGATACWGSNRYAQLGANDRDAHYFSSSAFNDGFSLATGGNHSCVLLSGALARCWGGNEYGQLGDATTNSSPVPQSVRSTESFVAIDAGLAHTCVIVSDATVRCWGHNNFGQLGDETTDNANAPVVSAVQDVRKLALGNSHTCAILLDGGAACWGRNEDGQLGVGGTANSAMPLRVADVDDATDIASGADHVCVVRQNGTVWCWGSNTYGQLGLGEAGPGVSIPAQVPGLANVVALGLGDFHSCALTADGTVWCWGWNNYGQVGAMQIDDKAVVSRPQQVAGLSDVVQLRVGGNHNCVLTQSASALCWGDNFNGQLGNPSLQETVRSIPTPVTSIARFVSLAAGGAHTCGLLRDGDVACWGWNRYGQVGNGSGGFAVDIVNPSPVVGLQEIISLAVGSKHLCATDTNGIVSCWGDNASGQLGIGVFGDTAALATPRTVTLAVPGLGSSVGVDHSCALLSSLELSCWGRNEFGQIGNGFAGDIADTAIPNFVTNFIGVTDFASGGNTNCAVLAGDVYCWGDNQYAQTGQTTTGIGDFRVQPTKVELLSEMRSVVVGKHHACALSLSGVVYCWGRNNQAQLGGISGELSATPSVIQNVTDVIQISAGDDHTCAVTANGQLACWGSNSAGQLGRDDEADESSPFVPDVVGVRQVATGSEHTCAYDGLYVTCWGNNHHGQLGIGNVSADEYLSANRTNVQNLAEVSAIVAGGNHSCAITKTNKEVWCWGQNENAQLGVTNNPDVKAPVAVIDLWSMQVNETVIEQPTAMPTVRLPKPTHTMVPTTLPAPTATLIRPRQP